MYIHVLCIQFILQFISVIANVFGTYCLQKQERKRKATRLRVVHRLLLKSFASIEIVKMLYDFIPVSIYHFDKDRYYDNIVYFTIIEINLMTIFFSSVAFIAINKLMVVLLEQRYRHYITRKLVIKILVATWVTASASGIGIWVLPGEIGFAKMYYYLTLETTVTVLIVLIFPVIMCRIRKRDPSLPSMQMKKPFLLSFLLCSCFITFDVTPDIVFFFNQTEDVYIVISFIWTVGYLLDPVIYIFHDTTRRKIAKDTSNFILCCFFVRSARVPERTLTSTTIPLSSKTKNSIDIAVTLKSTKQYTEENVIDDVNVEVTAFNHMEDAPERNGECLLLQNTTQNQCKDEHDRTDASTVALMHAS